MRKGERREEQYLQLNVNIITIMLLNIMVRTRRGGGRSRRVYREKGFV